MLTNLHEKVKKNKPNQTKTPNGEGEVKAKPRVWRMLGSSVRSKVQAFLPSSSTTFLFLQHRYETDGEKGRTDPVGDYLKATTTMKFP